MCISFQVSIDPIKVISATWTAMKRPFGYFKHPEAGISRLQNAIDSLHSKRGDLIDQLRSAELAGETPTHEVKDWLAKFDVVDGQVSKIRNDHHNGRSFRCCVNRRAEGCLAEITALAAVEFDTAATRLPPGGVQEVAAEWPVNASMEVYLSRLQAHIQDDRSRIIGIWGMGGVGKTTLLQGLNNQLLHSSESAQRAPAFDYVIWTVASKDCNLVKLQRDISERLGLPMHINQAQQANEIFDFLKNKSFLFLLDDLWQTVDLAEVGIPHPIRSGAGAMKQKVVFTTRLEGVCGQMQARPIMKLDCLGEDEAWQLFYDKVGDETIRAHARIPELARRVVKECDGLPLALVVIGAAMRTKRTPKEWQNTITMLQKSWPREIEGMEEKIMMKLKVSYDNLTDDIIRKCFLLCCLWPEDYSIPKTDLIDCWMGHGLIDERRFDNINEAYDNGHALIGSLQESCLLERDDVMETKVKMHDVIRDLALWIASNCGDKPNTCIMSSNALAYNRPEEVQRISLFHNVDRTSRFPTNCRNLETLILRECFSFTSSSFSQLFEATTSLVYLDLSCSIMQDVPSSWPSSIRHLVNLRYLDISNTRIQMLPLELRYLQELRFLLLRNLDKIIIPHGVLENLMKLSVVDLIGTRIENWKHLFIQLGRLKGTGILLETMYALHQLARLPNAQIWRLELRDLWGFEGPMRLLSSAQLGSHNIRSSIQMLKIQDCKDLEVVSMEIDGEGSSRSSQKWNLSRLEHMELGNLPALKEIIWGGVIPAEMLPNLTVVNIYGYKKLSDISWLMRLPSLEDLTVFSCQDLEQVVHDNHESISAAGDDAFPSLKNLLLSDLRSLRTFADPPLTLPSLKKLEVMFCPELRTLPFDPEVGGENLREIRGDGPWWEYLKMKGIVRTALLPRFMGMGGL